MQAEHQPTNALEKAVKTTIALLDCIANYMGDERLVAHSMIMAGITKFLQQLFEYCCQLLTGYDDYPTAMKKQSLLLLDKICFDIKLATMSHEMTLNGLPNIIKVIEAFF